jgi:hypothetical protein
MKDEDLYLGNSMNRNAYKRRMSSKTCDPLFVTMGKLHDRTCAIPLKIFAVLKVSYTQPLQLAYIETGKLLPLIFDFFLQL